MTTISHMSQCVLMAWLHMKLDYLSEPAEATREGAIWGLNGLSPVHEPSESILTFTFNVVQNGCCSSL